MSAQLWFSRTMTKTCPIPASAGGATGGTGSSGGAGAGAGVLACGVPWSAEAVPPPHAARSMEAASRRLHGRIQCVIPEETIPRQPSIPALRSRPSAAQLRGAWSVGPPTFHQDPVVEAPGRSDAKELGAGQSEGPHRIGAGAGGDPPEDPRSAELRLPQLQAGHAGAPHR